MSEEPIQPNKPVLRVDTLSDERLEDLNLKFRLVSLIKAGLRPRDALKRLAAEQPGLHHYTARWAEKLYRRYEEQGAPALADRRWQRKIEVVVFTPDLKDLTLAWYHARPAAGPKAIWKI